MAQAEQISAALAGAEIVRVRTDDGAVGDKARFVRGVERALLEGEVDLGVHSAKDLPGELPEGLAIAAVPGREESADAYVGSAASLGEVPEGARIGTSSLRRRAQLLALRADLEIVELRGNVDTRLAKLAEGTLDGIVLAAAGLRRLGRAAEVAFMFSPSEMTPAPGQGTLALEARREDRESRAAAARIGDEAALTELTAERAATTTLGASCRTPIGICAHTGADGIGIEAFAGLPDGSEWLRDSLAGPLDDPAGLGEELASRMLAAGAGELLERAEALA